MAGFRSAAWPDPNIVYWYNLIYPYTDNKDELYICPSSVHENAYRVSDPVSEWCSYGMNYGTGVNPFGWQKSNRINDPSGTFILANGYGDPDHGIGAGYHSAHVGYNMSERLPAYRHNGMANLLFFDWHVEPKTEEKLSDWDLWNREK